MIFKPHARFIILPEIMGRHFIVGIAGDVGKNKELHPQARDEDLGLKPNTLYELTELVSTLTVTEKGPIEESLLKGVCVSSEQPLGDIFLTKEEQDTLRKKDKPKKPKEDKPKVEKTKIEKIEKVKKVEEKPAKQLKEANGKSNGKPNGHKPSLGAKTKTSSTREVMTQVAKALGAKALKNLANGHTPQKIEKPAKKIAELPASVTLEAEWKEIKK